MYDNDNTRLNNTTYSGNDLKWFSLSSRIFNFDNLKWKDRNKTDVVGGGQVE